MTALERSCPAPTIKANEKQLEFTDADGKRWVRYSWDTIPNPQFEKVYGKWMWKRRLRVLKEWFRRTFRPIYVEIWFGILRPIYRDIKLRKYCYESIRTQSVPRG